MEGRISSGSPEDYNPLFPEPGDKVKLWELQVSWLWSLEGAPIAEMTPKSKQ